MTDSRETRSYPRGWIRVEIFPDRATVLYHRESVAHGSPEKLAAAVKSVLQTDVGRSGRCTVYCSTVSGAVFDCDNKPQNEQAKHAQPGAREGARIAARRGGPDLVDALCVMFEIRDNRVLGKINQEFADRLAALETGRSATAATATETPAPEPSPAPKEPELIDGLTPAQCYAAFVARQQDQRTFETEVRADRLQPGYIIPINGERYVVESNERLELGWHRKLTLRAEGVVVPSGTRVTREVQSAKDFPVIRSTELTPAQLARARQTWSALMRHDVGVSAQRAAAPSVTIACEALEIEALAGDVP